MKKIYIILFFLIFVQLCVVFPVSADPRMEINKNFCHFILGACRTFVVQYSG